MRRATIWIVIIASAMLLFVSVWIVIPAPSGNPGNSYFLAADSPNCRAIQSAIIGRTL